MHAIVVILISMCLTACGGGGGGGGSTPTPVQVPNRAPVIDDPGALTLLEGAASVTKISASDPDNNSLTFSISSGDDEALFTISSSGALSFSSVPDFEAPADLGADNVYDLIVQVSDGTLTDTQSINITVTDAFEGRVVDAPISGATVFIDLNGNNEQDEDEPTGLTDGNGFFKFATFTLPEGGGAKVVSKGGTDTKTGKALPDLALISDLPTDITKPANVTPLTTVIAAVDTPEAKAAVLAAMGISGSPEDLLTSDGWAAAEAGDEKAKANQRVNQQVGLLLQTATTVADDGDETTDVSVPLAQALAAQISSAAVSEKGIDLTSTDTLQTVLTESMAAVLPEVLIEADAIAAVAQSVASVNAVVSDPTLDPLSDVASDIVQSAQEALQTSVADVISGDVAVSDFVNATDTAELFSDIEVAVDALDTDEDGVPDALDVDDDGDGVADGVDAFSKDATETLDTDSDGTGNNADTDDDADGVADTADTYSLITLGGRTDTDNDGRPNDCDTACLSTGMAADTDDDADGVADTADAFPLIAIGARTDTDRDGLPNDCDAACQSTGMTADADDDADGVADGSDAFPLDSTETLDTDSDGIGNNADTDDDADGVADSSDDYPLNANVHTAPTATNASFNLSLLPQTTNTATQTLVSTSQGSRAVTYSIVTNGSTGTATITNASTGAFSYSTTGTTSVVDSFTFKVNDGYVDSSSGTISVSHKTDPLYKYQWHLDNTGQTSFTNNAGTTGADLNLDSAIVAGRTGAGVIVAVVDSGLEIAHEDLSDNVVTNGSWNLTNSTTDPTSSGSSGDHGTSVAGIIAAKGWNDVGVRGVAPNASIKGFNLLASGNGSASNEAKVLGGSSSSPNSSDVAIFNMSYGSIQFSSVPANVDMRYKGNSTVTDQLLASTTNLRSGKGSLYAYASGNEYNIGAKASGIYSYCGNGGNAGTFKIGCFDVMFDPISKSPYLIGVAALNANKTRASYSSPGSMNWVSAPGGESGNNSSFTSSGNPAIMTTDQSSCAKGYVSSNSTTKNAFMDNSNPHADNTSCNYTNSFNGTSSAAPNVAGVIALMLEANSNLKWRDVKHILATTAVQVDASFSASTINTVNYVGWITNGAALKFHPWYGFGAVDATAAINAAASHAVLADHSFTSWLNSTSESTTINDLTLFTRSLTESSAGTVEHILLRIRFDHSLPNHLGFRLESPAGTVSTLLPPLTVFQKNPTVSYYTYMATNAFYGEGKAGTWKLHIVDHTGGTTGTFAQWGIQFMYR